MDRRDFDSLCTTAPPSEHKCGDICFKVRKVVEEWNDDYQHDWPVYCRTCNGWGYIDAITYAENRGYKVVEVICSECLEIGLCPRCLSEDSFQDYVGVETDYCRQCGWEQHAGLAPVNCICSNE